MTLRLSDIKEEDIVYCTNVVVASKGQSYYIYRRNQYNDDLEEMGSLKISRFEDSEWLYLEDFEIYPQYREQGYGGKLFSAVVKYLRNYKIFLLWDGENRAAFNIYSSCYFKYVLTTGKYHIFINRDEDYSEYFKKIKIVEVE